MELNVFILEDSANRISKFRQNIKAYLTIETNVKDAIASLNAADFDLIYLDHDLGGEHYVPSEREDSGMEVIRWLIKERKQRTAEFIIHSHNVPAAERMTLSLRDNGYIVRAVPFSMLCTLWKL